MSRTAARTLRAEGPDEVVPVPRRLDARLLVPIAVSWPVVAFVGLVLPTTVLLDADGNIVATHAGELDENGLRELIADELGIES